MVATMTLPVNASAGPQGNLASSYGSLVAEERRIILSAWAQDRIDRWRKEKKPRSYQWIGNHIGCSKVHAINIHKNGKGVGQDLAISIAEKLFGGSQDAFYAEAKAWWDSGGRVVYRKRVPISDEERDANQPDDTPEFVHAVAAGNYLRETIDFARSRMRVAPHLSQDQWADYLDGLDRENRRFDRFLHAAPSPEIDVARAVKKADEVARNVTKGKRT